MGTQKSNGATFSAANVTTTSVAVVSTPVNTVTSVPSTFTIPFTTHNETTQSTNKVVDLNKCCMYFVTYEDDVLDDAGAEWIFVGGCTRVA